MFKNKKSNNKKKWILYLLLGGLFGKLFSFVFKEKGLKKLEDIEDNFEDFVEAEKEEIEELVDGEEGFDKYLSDSGNIFLDYFWPYQGNSHKPKILHTRSLVLIVVFALVVKTILASYLFFSFPQRAELSESIVSQVLELINHDRMENGLKTLAINPVLNEAAISKANDMLENNYFSHYGPDDKAPWLWIDRSQYPYVYAGENLARNFTTAQSVHTALMNSPTHRKNILNEKYSDLGLALLPGTLDGQNTNILVEFFASRSTLTPNPSPAIAMSSEGSIKNTESSERVSSGAGLEPQEGDSAGASVLSDSFVEDSAGADELEFREVSKEPILEHSPNPDLENNRQASILQVSAERNSKASLAVKVSQYIFLAMILIMIVILFFNIVIDITVQHKPIIIETLLVIIFIYSLTIIRWHFLENVIERIFIA